MNWRQIKVARETIEPHYFVEKVCENYFLCTDLDEEIYYRITPDEDGVIVEEINKELFNLLFKDRLETI